MMLFGEEGQERLKKAHIFIAGAGGLGSPVSIYLAVAGIGTITIVDMDVVDQTNLIGRFSILIVISEGKRPHLLKKNCGNSTRIS